MVGSPDPADSSAGQESGIPRVKTFSCSSCGASVTIRYPGQSMTAVCDSCLTTIDVTDDNYRILTQYFSKTAAFSPTIPLGSRGELMGKRWEVIGYLVRMDVASSYMWDEYLLFNPYYGYRWLTENKGHWNFVTPIKEKPRASYTRYIHGGEQYQLFYKGDVEIYYVLGEFYWKVKVGKQVKMQDYICPPKMLSVEYDESELGWSVSEYVEPEVVQTAFKPDKPRARLSVGANQPSPWIRTCNGMATVWLVSFIILTGIEFWQVTSATAKKIFQSSYPFITNQKSVSTITTPVFTAEKDLANLQLDFQASVNNSWLYLSGELVDNKTGETYSFDRTIEYYQGTDSDGPWTEGSQTSQLLLPSVPKGQYYLNLDTESAGFPVGGQTESFNVMVSRNVPTYANYLWCLLAVSILPCVAWWKSLTFETARWSDSDYSPYSSSN